MSSPYESVIALARGLKYGDISVESGACAIHRIAIDLFKKQVKETGEKATWLPEMYCRDGDVWLVEFRARPAHPMESLYPHLPNTKESIYYESSWVSEIEDWTFRGTLANTFGLTAYLCTNPPKKGIV